MGDYWDDPVDESSGLLTHFVGQVEDSFWSTLSAETKGQVTGDFANNTQLFWHVNVLDALQGDFEREVPDTLTINVGIGKKWWQDPENDDLVENEDDTEDKPQKFQHQSAYGKILGMVAGKGEKALGDYKVLDNDGDITIDMTGVANYFRKMGHKDARNAKIWEGLVFEFRGIGFPMRDNQNPRPKAFPVRYLGDDPDVVTSAQVEQNTPDEVIPEDSPWLEFTDPATSNLLNKLARSSGSHQDFVRNAVMLPAVKGNDALKDAIEDESNYTDLTGS